MIRLQSAKCSARLQPFTEDVPAAPENFIFGVTNTCRRHCGDSSAVCKCHYLLTYLLTYLKAVIAATRMTVLSACERSDEAYSWKWPQRSGYVGILAAVSTGRRRGGYWSWYVTTEECPLVSATLRDWQPVWATSCLLNPHTGSGKNTVPTGRTGFLLSQPQGAFVSRRRASLDWRGGITASTTVRFLSTPDRSANPAQHHRRPIISCDCRTCMEQCSYQHHSINLFAIFQETT